MTVEIDETVFTSQKNQAGRILHQQWVFGALCRETGDCFMIPVHNRSIDTLEPIISANIYPGTTVILDLWRAYNSIGTIDMIHQRVNKSLNFVGPITGANIQSIERMWKSAKERNKRHNGTDRHMLESYTWLG